MHSSISLLIVRLHVLFRPGNHFDTLLWACEVVFLLMHAGKKED